MGVQAEPMGIAPLAPLDVAVCLARRAYACGHTWLEATDFASHGPAGDAPAKNI